MHEMYLLPCAQASHFRVADALYASAALVLMQKIPPSRRRLTKVQRAFVVKNFFENKSFEIVQQRFEERFLERSSPTKKTIWNNVMKFNNEETAMNFIEDRSRRKKTRRTQENINLVLEYLLEDPKISARKNSLDRNKDTFHISDNN